MPLNLKVRIVWIRKISTKTENIWNCNKIKRLINLMQLTKNGCNRIWLQLRNTCQWHSMLHIRKSESFVLFQRSKWTKCNYNNSKYWEQTNLKSTEKTCLYKSTRLHSPLFRADVNAGSEKESENCENVTTQSRVAMSVLLMALKPVDTYVHWISIISIECLIIRVLVASFVEFKQQNRM